MVRFCPPFKFRESGSVDIPPIDETRVVENGSAGDRIKRPTIRFTGDMLTMSPTMAETMAPAATPTPGVASPSPVPAVAETPPLNRVASVPKRPNNGSIAGETPHLKKTNNNVSELIQTAADAQTDDEDYDDDAVDESQEQVPAAPPQRRKQGVLVTSAALEDEDLQLQSAEQQPAKDASERELIRAALLANDFIANLLDERRLDAVVAAMKPERYAAGAYIIREGENGSHLYVSDAGALEVIKGGRVVKKFGGGEAFGELAVLYKAKRFASIRASSDTKVWSLERKVFQTIMVRSGKQEQEDNLRFLSSVPVLEGIHPMDLLKISDFLRREFFAAGTMIVRQGERGDKFFIIRGGTVVITQRSPDGGPDKFIKELGRGDYFGEQALLREDRRLATVTAKAPGVECLTMARGPFNEFLGNIEELKKNYGVAARSSITVPRKKLEGPQEYSHIQLNDLEIVGTLGVGAFGRVELVQYGKDKSLTFALKCLKKVDVVQQQQQQHAFSEKEIMYQCNSPFICKLYRTYRDSKYLYFLMEPILGGDVWTILQRKRCFDERTARFMSACVVEALEHLHARGIVYRDLKPENLMLDARGYVKLVDFGYAKFLAGGGDAARTYTFAGTPEYVAPEIVLGNGHDRAVDYWALGIFVHELLVGKPPFRGTNHVKTYNLIIRGIDAIDFSPKVSKVAQVLIKKLCRSLPTERLGYLRNGIKDIKNHKWFLGFDWDKLRECKMTAPLIRPIANNKDLTNFEKYEKDKIPPDETSGWDLDF